MKKILLFVFVFSMAALFTKEVKAEPPAGMYFYSELSPYGSWIEMNDGLVVWRPVHMQRHWAPYATGRWVYTPYGWYWDSYEPFGDIVYHYGRWYNDDYYGWIWVPDNQWGPAWVEWRYDDDYIGWAPLSPYGTFSINIGINFSHDYHPGYAYWNFVQVNNFCNPHVYNYYVPSKTKYRVYEHTRYRTEYDYRNGAPFNRGVDVDVIRKRTKQDITVREVERVTDRSQITRNSGRDEGRIRTLEVKNDAISREGLKGVKVERSDRKTSLDVAKVQVGREQRTGLTTQRGNNNTPEIRQNTGRNNTDKKEPVRNNTDARIEQNRQQQTQQKRVTEQQQRIEQQRKQDEQRKAQIIQRQQKDSENQRIQQQQRVEQEKQTQINRQQQMEKQNNERARQEQQKREQQQVQKQKQEQQQREQQVRQQREQQQKVEMQKRENTRQENRTRDNNNGSRNNSNDKPRR